MDEQTPNTLVRTALTTVGVDSATMVIAARGCWLDSIWWGKLPLCHDGAVVSATGIGDGRYHVAVVRDTAGDAVGVEVVFQTPEFDADIDALLAAQGVAPLDEKVLSISWGTAAAATPQEHSAALDTVNRWQDAYSAAYELVFADRFATSSPAAAASANSVGTIVNPTGIWEIGDPCYGEPSATVSTMPGIYSAISWHAEIFDFGQRTVRLGVYRTADVPDEASTD